jgi:hypothetical protein
MVGFDSCRRKVMLLDFYVKKALRFHWRSGRMPPSLIVSSSESRAMGQPVDSAGGTGITYLSGERLNLPTECRHGTKASLAQQEELTPHHLH